MQEFPTRKRSFPKPKVKRPIGIKVTLRDLKLLEDLFQNVQLSFEQVHRRHFSGRSRVTAVNRLSRLRAEGLVRGLRVGTIIYQLREREIGTVYHITRKGLLVLSDRYGERNYPKRPVRVGGKDLVHDLILTEVRAKLIEGRAAASIISGKNLHRGPKENAQVPDLVMFSPGESGSAAIELELTAKSEKRYRQIILQYRTDRSYERVIYVVGKASIGDKILAQITGRKVAPSGIRLPTGKFEIVSLQSILGRGPNQKYSTSTQLHLGENP